MARKLTDRTFIVFFITRATMFIVKDEKEYIMAFMTGYEIGKGTDLLTRLSKLLEDKYKYPRRSTGWNGQIELFSDEAGLRWESSFK